MKVPEGFNYTMFREIEITYSPAVVGPKLNSSRAVYDFMMNYYTDIDYVESAYVILFNRAGNVLGFKRISVGSMSGTIMDPKHIYQIALKGHAASIVVIHNHPSRNLRPSSNDSRITKQLKEAGTFLELPLLDHLIVTASDYFSFADEGML